MPFSHKRLWVSFGRVLRSTAWPLGLAMWLVSHAAWGQSPPLRDLREAVVEQARSGRLQWRLDDPDLVRSGPRPTPAATLAEGVRVIRSEALDLDGDGVDERVMEVEPRRDPAPYNTASGLVVVRRFAEGFYGWIVARPGPDHTHPTTCGPILPIGWGLHVEGGRRVLVVGYELVEYPERDEGHGRTERRVTILARVRIEGDSFRAEGICATAVQEGDWHDAWHGVGAACMRFEQSYSGEEISERRPRRDCHEPIARGAYNYVWQWQQRTAPPAWCRAFARGMPFRFTQPADSE